MWEVESESDSEVGGTEGEMVKWEVQRERDDEVGDKDGERW